MLDDYTRVLQGLHSARLGGAPQRYADELAEELGIGVVDVRAELRRAKREGHVDATPGFKKVNYTITDSGIRYCDPSVEGGGP